MKNKKERGFTLLELLVVIGIIGLLASILVVNLTGARKRARDTKRIGDIRNLQIALEDYYGKNAKYPTIISDMVTGGQIPMWPLDPLAPAGTTCSDNSDLCYYYASYPATNPYSYHIGASLEEAGSLLLNQDRDCNSISGTAKCPVQSAYTNGFNGDTDLTVGCGGVANRYCYDIAQ